MEYDGGGSCWGGSRPIKQAFLNSNTNPSTQFSDLLLVVNIIIIIMIIILYFVVFSHFLFF